MTIENDPFAPRPRDGHPAPGELDAAAFGPDVGLGAPTAATRAHLASCERCRSEVSSLRGARDEYLARRPATELLKALRARGEPSGEGADERSQEKGLRRRGSVGRGLRTVIPLAAAASIALVAGLVLRPLFVDHGEGAAGGSVTLKGTSLALALHRSRGGEPARPADLAEPFQRGDVIRFVVTVPEDGFVIVANLDDRGEVTRYYPADGAASALISSGAATALPGSIELDDFEGRERVSLFFGTRPFEEGVVRKALRDAYERAGGDLATLDVKVEPALELREISVLLRKERAR